MWYCTAELLSLSTALSSIGCSDGDVMEQVLWTVRCDKVPAVRAEACHTLSHLWGGEGEGEGKTRLITALRDRLVVEEDAVVTRELVSALRGLGGECERSDPLLQFIQTQVQRLGTSHAISEGILKNDLDIMTDYIIARPRAHPSTRDYLTQHHR